MNPLPWRPHLLSNIAFGQGIAVTPLQITAAYAAVANGGILRRPILVKSIRSHDKETPVEFQAEDVRRVLTTQEAATMRMMLTAATDENSTGINARIPGYQVAGKTGTAQKADTIHGGYVKGGYISSFAGFVPAHNPRYVIYIAVDNPKKAYYGAQVAAPVFSKMAQYLVRRAGLPPVLISENNVIVNTTAEEKKRSALQQAAINELKKSSEPAAASESEAASKQFPNLMGLTLREGLSRIRQQATQVEVRGHGVIVRTNPPAGAILAGKRRVTLVLENPD
jgi:cell division protein FtsI (penicillin-binding protein 3)